jgi:hypothetical protein
LQIPVKIADQTIQRPAFSLAGRQAGTRLQFDVFPAVRATTHLISNTFHAVYEPLHDAQKFDNCWEIRVERVLEL